MPQNRCDLEGNVPEEVLVLDKLCTGDRPSVIAAGMLLAHALRKSTVAVVAVNALGQVVVLPPESVGPVPTPQVQDDDLNELTEDEALSVLLKEGRPEPQILSYLKRRNLQG